MISYILFFDAPFWLKTFSFVLSLVFVGLIFYIHSKMAEIRYSTTPKSTEDPARNKYPATSDSVSARWQEVKNHISSSNEAEWKFAIVEADKLVDSLLKEAGYPGESMGERLTAIEPGQLTTLQGLWEAHKVRNQIAHDIDYFIRDVNARRAIDQYEATLRELQVL